MRSLHFQLLFRAHRHRAAVALILDRHVIVVAVPIIAFSLFVYNVVIFRHRHTHRTLASGELKILEPGSRAQMLLIRMQPICTLFAYSLTLPVSLALIQYIFNGPK